MARPALDNTPVLCLLIYNGIYKWKKCEQQQQTLRSSYVYSHLPILSNNGVCVLLKWNVNCNAARLNLIFVRNNGKEFAFSSKWLSSQFCWFQLGNQYLEHILHKKQFSIHWTANIKKMLKKVKKIWTPRTRNHNKCIMQIWTFQPMVRIWSRWYFSKLHFILFCNKPFECNIMYILIISAANGIISN